jgi:osmotically-inducible protein OsmY
MRITMALLIAGLLGSFGCSRQSTAGAGAKQLVQSKLATDPQLTRIEVDASTTGNQLTLKGSVSSEQARAEAVNIAKVMAPGVTVIDRIDVQTEAASRADYSEKTADNAREKARALGDKIGKSLDDAWVYAKIEAKLMGHSAEPVLKINVDVENNVVTLRGEVETAEMKMDAERIARETEGVKAVRNLLQVRT